MNNKPLQQLMTEAKNDKAITVIAKVTNLCNFKCPYCYNKALEKKARSNPNCVTIMPIETMERVIFNMARYYRHAILILHGGEPLIPGLGWYEQFVELLKKYKLRYRVDLRVAVQSNGTLLNEQLLNLFKENNITVGFSFDGLTNDRTRGHTTQILQSMEKYRAQVNPRVGGICLVTQHNIDNLIDEYEYFNALQIEPQFNPVFPATDIEEGLLIDDLVDQYVESYCKLFNHYVTRSSPCVPMTNFDALIRAALGDDSHLACENIICHYRWISVTPTGDYYPCGREWPSEYCFGNVHEHTFEEAFESEAYQSFVAETLTRLEYCKYDKECPIFSVCHGACPASSVTELGHAKLPSERECKMRRGIFTHVYNYIRGGHPITNEHVLRDVLGRR